ncbi:MAG: M43 family zinc metalloprotease [Bacteroidia bacterium]
MEKQPILRYKQEQLESLIYYQSDKNYPLSELQSQTMHTIPVVVHIIHNNGPENISDIQVQQAIQDMNLAFMNQGNYYHLDGVAVNIQFCLATRDTNGNFSTGITRTVSNLTNLTLETDDIALKDLTRWDPTKYINIWLVNDINSTSVGPGVAGYANFPSSHGDPNDGIVNEAQWFGSSTNNSKIHIHEMGHYLGLYHTFEGGCANSNCLLNGDRVCDTPPDASTSWVTCPGTINTCSTDENDTSANNPFRPVAIGGLGDQQDLTIDYMDYGFQSCQTLFTLGQSDRMNLMLTSARSSLLTSDGCFAPCTSPIVVSFSSSANTINSGTLVNFTNNSTGASTFSWEINGNVFSTMFNTTYNFNTPGKYIITLVASNGDPFCTQKIYDTIQVNCGAQAYFNYTSTVIFPGETVSFSNTSTGATGYEWFIDGTSQSTSTNFNYVFNNIGGFMVYLVANNGVCFDTSAYIFIRVGICDNKQINQWIFGKNAGLNFNSGTPIPFSGSVMIQFEGCSSIADENGNLLFYSDGINVWNKNHQQMPNGFGLKGDQSSSQSALILKQPTNDSLYYLFTTDNSEDSLLDGFQYNIININLNGGMGDVVVKNQLLVTPTSEKQTAVKHCNGRDIWVISHKWQSDAFYSYLLTPTGLNPTPVISYSGSIHTGGLNLFQRARGCMKTSPDGKRLALAIQNSPDGKFEFFDFDNATGIVSNGILTGNYSYAYGLEFSPDGTKVYGTTVSFGGEIYQFNMLAGSPAAILASATIIGSSVNQPKALQLGPDGKIYATKFGSSQLAIINNPNALGLASGFVDNGIDLFPNTPYVGLPNSSTSFFYNTKPEIIGPTQVCANAGSKSYSVKSLDCSLNKNYWKIQGNATIISFTDTSVTLDFPLPGFSSLIVEKISSCGNSTDTILIESIQRINSLLGNDTSNCTSAPLLLQADNGFISYLWQDGSSLPTFTALGIGSYWVTVIDTFGCTGSDTIQILAFNPPMSLNLGQDTSICYGAILPLDPGTGFTNYHWQDHSTQPTFTAYAAGKYFVDVSNNCYTGSDTIIISLLPDTLIQLGMDTTLCDDSTLTLHVGNGFINSIWQNGSNQPTFTVTEIGIYYVSATTADGCEYHDTIAVERCIINDINEEPIDENEVTVSPNPGEGIFLVTIKTSNIEKINVYNKLGQLIYFWSDIHSPKFKVDISTFANGMYFFNIRSQEKNYNKKILLLR